MREMTSGTALRQLQQAQAGLKKARQALRLARDDRNAVPHLLELGWQSLTRAHGVVASIPLSAASEEVMTRQLALERYTTALLVRLRRLLRSGSPTIDIDEDADLDDDDL